MFKGVCNKKLYKVLAATLFFKTDAHSNFRAFVILHFSSWLVIYVGFVATLLTNLYLVLDLVRMMRYPFKQGRSMVLVFFIIGFLMVTLMIVVDFVLGDIIFA